ncbi:MAG: FHA domain-containing protein [Clostridia bacterium]|nr:FHA domain-containing protein [Clostridia bacterium]
MPEEIYELIAQGARYWFLFLMVLIVWRSWRWYRKDRRQARKRMKLLPDAGFIGEMIVIQGSDHLQRGTALPVPREGTLGYSRTNDLCIPVAGVEKRHLWFRFEDGKGLLTDPYGKNPVIVDGEAFESRRHPLYLAHGSRLYVGECELRLRLFAGFEATGHALRQPGVEEPQPDPDQAQQMAWQQAMMAQQQAMMAHQQWMMQQQYAAQQAFEQGYQQAMMAQQQYAGEEEEEILYDDAADVYTYEAAREQGLVDDSAFRRPAGEKKPELPVYDEPVVETEFYAPVADEDEDEEPFYPPVMDEDDMTDAAAPPKSAYVGHDEAERAKRQVWDKYFGGGQR